MARNAAQDREWFKGFEVIQDTVEIDETIEADDSITVEGCKGFVLVELPKSSELSSEQIFSRAFQLAELAKPYGIERIYWSHEYEGNNSFLRFTVVAFEEISRSKRDEDAAEMKAEDRSEARREVSL